MITEQTYSTRKPLKELIFLSTWLCVNVVHKSPEKSGKNKIPNYWPFYSTGSLFTNFTFEIATFLANLTMSFHQFS